MAGRIEFVEPDAPSDPAPSDPAPAPPGRRRTAIAIVAAAAVLIAVLIARGVGADHGGSAAPGPKPQRVDSVVGPEADALSEVLHSQIGSAVVGYCAGSSALPLVPETVTMFSVVPAATGGERLEVSRPDSTPCTHSAATCPGAGAGRTECATTDIVPAAVFDAVSHRYPDARLALSTTETVRTSGALWYRLLVCALPHGQTLRIDVVRGSTSHARPDEFDDPGSTVARAVHTDGAVDTIATIGGPGRPDTVTLMELTTDPVMSSVH